MDQQAESKPYFHQVNPCKPCLHRSSTETYVQGHGLMAVKLRKNDQFVSMIHEGPCHYHENLRKRLS